MCHISRTTACLIDFEGQVHDADGPKIVKPLYESVHFELSP